MRIWQKPMCCEINFGKLSIISTMNTFIMHKQYRSLALFFAFFFSLTAAYSQNFSFGVIASAGISYIGSDDSCPSMDVGNVNHFSGNVGFYLEQYLTKNTSLGMRASWVNIKGGERMWDVPVQITNDENQTETLMTTYRSAMSSHYLAVPVYLRKEHEYGGISIGLRPMFFLGAGSDITDVFPEFDSELALNSIDIGMDVGCDWNLTRTMRLSLEYYHGLRDIGLKTDSHRRYNSQLTFGIQYTLYK
jgi:hypothetical protein